MSSSERECPFLDTIPHIHFLLTVHPPLLTCDMQWIILLRVILILVFIFASCCFSILASCYIKPAPREGGLHPQIGRSETYQSCSFITFYFSFCAVYVNTPIPSIPASIISPSTASLSTISLLLFNNCRHLHSQEYLIVLLQEHA